MQPRSCPEVRQGRPLVLGGRPDDDTGPGAEIDAVVGAELLLHPDGDRVARDGSVAAGATNVPLAESRSSTHQRVPSVVSWALAAADTGVGLAVDRRGWMLRLCEIRPTKIDFSRNGRTIRQPRRGHRIRALLGFVPRRIDPDLGDPVKGRRSLGVRRRREVIRRSGLAASEWGMAWPGDAAATRGRGIVPVVKS